MSRRIEVELTSSNDQGVWTWRAAGAKQPRGTVSADRLYEGAKIGDVVRAEADFGIDGIAIVSVTPPKRREASVPADRLELKGSDRPVRPVTTTLTSRGRHDRRRPTERGDRTARPRSGGRGDRARTEEPRARSEGPTRRPERPATAARPQPYKLNPANTHRAAALAALPEEQRPIGEQLLKGGIPAVRRAIEAQNAEATAKGLPPVPEDQVISLAESLLPKLNSASWRDRAEAARNAGDKVSLRDLRAIVGGADAARDDESRELAASLRSQLQERVAAARDGWLSEMAGLLDEGRVVRALRVSARPPNPGDSFPAELASRLSEAASEAMSPETDPDRWAALMEAVAASPVRRSVRPGGLPEQAPEALVSQAKQLSGRIPALAAMLGIEMPPPPGPRRPGPPPRRAAPDSDNNDAQGQQAPPAAARGEEQASPQPGEPASE